ncbi:MAG: caspase family protein [Marinicella sp.]
MNLYNLKNTFILLVTCMVLISGCCNKKNTNLSTNKSNLSIIQPKRFALIIGNSNYQTVNPLPSAQNDAAGMRSALQRLGFEVITGTNLSKTETFEKVTQFTDLINSNNSKGLETVLYYSGLASYMNGVDYLLPVNNYLEFPEDLINEMIPLSEVVSQINKANPDGINIVITDTSRRNIFANEFRESDVPENQKFNIKNTYFAFATNPKFPASDSIEHQAHGLFTESILRYIFTSDLTIDQLFKLVRKDVMKATVGKQIVQTISTLNGDYYFKRSNQ